MTMQTELFPKTELDEATAVLAHLMAEEEKKEKTLATARENYHDAVERVLKQQHVVDKLQAMMPAAEPAAEAVGVEIDGNVEDADFEPLAIEGDVLDPITGEVVSKVAQEPAA